MDTKKLRQKILDLAIRGKLVPQDPNDEPASVLLERIRAEKERLIKEGKIKRGKKSGADTPVFENIDFEIPNSWEITTLSEVFYMHAGKAISSSAISSKQDGNNRYLCFGGNGQRGYVDSYNTEGAHPIIGRQGALCGNINYYEGKFYATEHAVVVDLFCETSTWWAYYFLTQLNLNQYATATAQPGLSVNTIGEVQIPLPPLAEQQRIVSAIEQWFAEIDILENAKDDLQTSIAKAKSKILDLAIHGKLVPQDPNDEPASVLLERIRAEKERLIKEGKIKRGKKSGADTPVFENIDFEIPNSWEITTLSEVFYMHAGKAISSSAISSKQDGNNRYLCFGGNGQRGYVDSYNTEGAHPIIGRQGALCGNINYYEGKFYATEHAVVVDLFCETSTWWAYYFLTQLNLNQYATATAQPGLSVNTIGEVQIPLPPLAEQQRIVAKIEELFAVLDNIKESIEV